MICGIAICTLAATDCFFQPPMFNSLLRWAPLLAAVAGRAFASKNKTHKSAAKRFFKLSTGGYAHAPAGRNHNFATKSNPYRRRHRGMELCTTGQNSRIAKLHA